MNLHDRGHLTMSTRLPDPSDLAYISATAALGLFRRRRLSPVELMRAVIDRAQQVNQQVNAFADTYFDEALKLARKAESRWMRRSAAPRALEGLPVAVKDAQRIAGKRTTYGSLALRDNVDRLSDPMIDRLLRAGAVVHARTTTPEFCLSGICRSRIWGTTRNPWNPAYGPGGSSGGSAASLAAGTTILATGTDTGGSIRVPASACGIVGYKPPHGRNPDGWPANLDPYSHCGPMARVVADLALMQSVTAGPHPLDHDSLPAPPRLPRTARDIKGMRIAYSLDLGYLPVERSVRRNTQAALALLRSLGCRTEEVDLGWTRDVDAICAHWFNATHFGRLPIWHARRHPRLLCPETLRTARAAAKHTALDDVPKAFECANRMYESFGGVMTAHDLFICPTMTIPAVKADQDPFDRNFRIEGVKVDAEFGYSATHHFNMLSNCPVMSIQSGFSDDCVPTGIQLVGRSFDEVTVFKVALAFESARGRWYDAAALRPAL
jgi:Asp-tRNA(Asn)/Glu-tRNA(Gln) amidotransferase A subunit family amidase